MKKIQNDTNRKTATRSICCAYSSKRIPESFNSFKLSLYIADATPYPPAYNVNRGNGITACKALSFQVGF